MPPPSRNPNPPTPARRRVLEAVRRRGPVAAPELAGALDTTDVAVRQHLAALEEDGLVASAPLPASGRGRPPSGWVVTPRARQFLPDTHAELTVGLIDAIEQGVGEEGLARVLDARANRQVAAYRAAMPKGAALGPRVRALARLRAREGYMAEARRAADGAWLLIEHHCPICDAAQRCRGLCTLELDVFRRVLGDRVRVERVEHVLEDGQRCVYEVRGDRSR